MPRKFEGYSPDAIDCYSQAVALGEDFGVLVWVSFTWEGDWVVATATCRRIAESPDGAVVVQARAKRPLKSRPDMALMAFTVMQDCWHQLDRGVLGVKPPAVTHSWSGRPHVARRST